MTSATYLMLTGAGAPTLPDDHFYRVKHQETLGLEKTCVEVRRRLWVRWWPWPLPWSLKLGEQEYWTRRDEEASAMEILSFLCEKAVENSEVNRFENARSRDLQRMAGDHP